MNRTTGMSERNTLTNLQEHIQKEGQIRCEIGPRQQFFSESHSFEQIHDDEHRSIGRMVVMDIGNGGMLKTTGNLGFSKKSTDLVLWCRMRALQCLHCHRSTQLFVPSQKHRRRSTASDFPRGRVPWFSRICFVWSPSTPMGETFTAIVFPHNCESAGDNSITANRPVIIHWSLNFRMCRCPILT